MNLHDPIELEKYINNLINNGNLFAFYNTSEWHSLRTEVLAEQHHECQLCKARGIHTQADTVHHVKYVLYNPRLALSKTYQDHEGKEQIQLQAICKTCHNIIHQRKKKQQSFTNKERW